VGGTVPTQRDLRDYRLRNLCQGEWPEFGLGWQVEGTWDLKLIRTVEEYCAVNHPNQWVYILSVQARQQELLPPPPPPQGTVPGAPTLGTGPPPYSPESTEAAKKHYPSLEKYQEETKEKKSQRMPSDASPAQTRRHGAPVWSGDSPTGPALQMPLRTVPVINNRNEIVQAYQVVPFSSCDILNWKNNTPPYSEEPQAMARLLEGIMATHNPTWQDCRQLLNMLFTSEERRAVLNNGVAIAQVGAPQDGDAAEWGAQRFPVEIDPQWDTAEEGHLQRLKGFQRILVEAVKRGPPRPVNIIKIQGVVQEKSESPTAFLERLEAAYRKYSPYNLEDENGRRAIQQSFISQAAPDIRRKIQKQPGFLGKTMNELLALADQVYMARDQVEQEKKDRKKKQEYQALVTMMEQSASGQRGRGGYARGGQGGRRGPPRRLGRDQCAKCKKFGHWKGECPEGKEGSQEGLRGRGRNLEDKENIAQFKICGL
uniref:Core shell protein Gag P30 domain-containing protein n=1 Tax=Anolis carolinensis TaxID=28377 RepID=R4GCV7_ANOCA